MLIFIYFYNFKHVCPECINMTTALKLILCAVIAYFLGSFNGAIFLSKLLGKDVRSGGSGNAGATNIARIHGMGAGIATFLFDFFKAALAMYLGRLLAGDWGVCVAGIVCLLGHCYPFLHHFRGGKGVSSGAAVAFFIKPWFLAVALAVFAVLALTTKKVSLSSIVATFSALILGIVTGVSLPYMILIFIANIIIISRHSKNIERLINGTESDFEAKK